VIGCAGKAVERQVIIRSRIILNERFRPTWAKAGTAGEGKWFEEAIELQLKYFQGFLQNDAGLRKSSSTHSAVSAYRVPPTVLKVSAANYPLALTIDRFRESSKLHEYIKSAMTLGQTTLADSAVEIRYQATRMITTCHLTSSPDEVALPFTRLPLPVDPFLALWFVPPANRTVRTFSGKTSMTSPCATAEMAEFGNASEYWYLWSPSSKGCKEFEGAYLEPALIEAQKKTEELQKLAGPWAGLKRKSSLRVTVLFGNLTTERFKQLDPKLLVKQLPGLAGDSAPPGSIWLPPYIRPAMGDVYEPGAREMLIFLNYLKNIIKISRVEPPLRVDTKGPLEFTISGLLTGSRQAVRIQVFYGFTTSYSPGGFQHWKRLLKAIEEDDFVFYTGHASLGVNASMDVMKQELGLTAAQLRSKVSKRSYLFVGLMSCYSYSFFGEDLMNLRAGLTTDVLLSGTREAGAKYILSSLRMLDLGLTDATQATTNALRNVIPPNQFFLLRRSEPGPIR